MATFETMGLPHPLMNAIRFMKFETPTPIQLQAIPPALEGRDILGSAQTGTGKTGAFGIPLVARLIGDRDSHALVMTPTRELAAQVMSQLRSLLGPKSPIRTALLIGGEPMPRQLSQLKARPRLIVGTPGRINDHLLRKSLKLDQASFLVLDETDRMLDMGFTDQIERVLNYMPEQRQTLLFSATLPKNILAIANRYLVEPVRVAVTPEAIVAPNLNQVVVHLDDDQKYDWLTDHLDQIRGSAIIFVKTKYGTEKLAKRLGRDGLRALAIHGDLRQNQRNRVIADFRQQKVTILVATDVAARGLDIPHIDHVINYDLPQNPEDYVHRIGRTARAGREGEATSLVTRSDKGKWRAIERLLSPDEERDRQENRGGSGKANGDKNRRRFNAKRKQRSSANANTTSAPRKKPASKAGFKPRGKSGGNDGGGMKGQGKPQNRQVKAKVKRPTSKAA